jgi:diadenosine tetraphosphate (Ap4A) HIT family hydrolase
LGNTWEFDCLGCAIARGTMAVPGGFILKTQHFCVHQDPLIPLPGFIVVGSNRHILAINEMTEPEYADFTVLLRRTQAAIKAAIQVEYLTLIQEEHSSHFHLWFFPWSAEVLQQYGEPALKSIREIMAAESRQVIDQARWSTLEAAIIKIKESI